MNSYSAPHPHARSGVDVYWSDVSPTVSVIFDRGVGEGVCASDASAMPHTSVAATSATSMRTMRLTGVFLREEAPTSRGFADRHRPERSQQRHHLVVEPAVGHEQIAPRARGLPVEGRDLPSRLLHDQARG